MSKHGNFSNQDFIKPDVWYEFNNISDKRLWFTIARIHDGVVK